MKSGEIFLTQFFPTPGWVLTPTENNQGRTVGTCASRTAMIIELFELERICKGHLAQPPCNAQGHPQLHQVVRAPSPVLGGLQGWGTTASGHHECKWNNSLCRNLNPSSVGFGLVAGVGSASPCAAVSSTPSPAPCRAAPCRATAAAAPSPPRAHRPHAGSCRQRGSAAALLFTEMGICMMKITRDGF